MATELTQETFKSRVVDGGEVAVVDFWAEWCQPCNMLAPTIDEIADDYGDKVLVGKVNADENQDTVREQSISALPTVVFFKDGSEVDRLTGLVQKKDIEEKIKELIE